MYDPLEKAHDQSTDILPFLIKTPTAVKLQWTNYAFTSFVLRCLKSAAGKSWDKKGGVCDYATQKYGFNM